MEAANHDWACINVPGLRSARGGRHVLGGGLQGNADSIKCGSHLTVVFVKVEQQGGRAELVLLKRRPLKMPALTAQLAARY